MYIYIYIYMCVCVYVYTYILLFDIALYRALHSKTDCNQYQC